MSTLYQIREGLSKARDSVTEGWNEIRELTGHALTRFQPKTSRGELSESAEDRIVNRSSRWGFLAAEVTDDGDKIQVMLEVPGLETNDFSLEVRDDMLVVRGEKRVSREETKGHYHVMERAYGNFERAIRLPARVEDEGASATYRSGVLTVTLKKSRAAQSRRINVEAA